MGFSVQIILRDSLNRHIFTIVFIYDFAAIKRRIEFRIDYTLMAFVSLSDRSKLKINRNSVKVQAGN